MLQFILSLQFLVGLAIGAAAGGFVGVGLARRSKTANDYYDRARARWDETEAQLRAEIQRLQDKARG